MVPSAILKLKFLLAILLVYAGFIVACVRLKSYLNPENYTPMGELGSRMCQEGRVVTCCDNGKLSDDKSTCDVGLISGPCPITYVKEGCESGVYLFFLFALIFKGLIIMPLSTFRLYKNIANINSLWFQNDKSYISGIPRCDNEKYGLSFYFLIIYIPLIEVLFFVSALNQYYLIKRDLQVVILNVPWNTLIIVFYSLKCSWNDVLKVLLMDDVIYFTEVTCNKNLDGKPNEVEMGKPDV